MILKEKEAHYGADERGFYGHKQEQDVAFHLRREFGGSEQVRIIHDLVIEHGGERAQIDHPRWSTRAPPVVGRASRYPGAGRITLRLLETATINIWSIGRRKVRCDGSNRPKADMPEKAASTFIGDMQHAR
jgi:hypothetical protein